MADTTTIQWVYPPNWQGEGQLGQVGYRRITVHLTGVSDSTGETNAIKVNLSEWYTKQRVLATKTAVEKIDYQVFGERVTLAWDRTPDKTIAILNAGSDDADSGCHDWRAQGGLIDPGEGSTGDIILTTTNGASGDSYDITITLRLKD